MAKYILIAALVALSVALCAGVPIDGRITDEHNIDQCDTLRAIKNVLATNVYEHAVLGIAKRTIDFPEFGINKAPITCLKVINLDSRDLGGYPEILSGGVGNTDVHILLKSRLGLPLNFRIEIWTA